MNQEQEQEEPKRETLFQFIRRAFHHDRQKPEHKPDPAGEGSLGSRESGETRAGTEPKHCPDT
jgi:hypothetical protein